jgi:hypothetical protein
MDHSDMIIAELYHNRESTLKSKLAKFEANAFINTMSLLVNKLFGNDSVSSAWSSKPSPGLLSSLLFHETRQTLLMLSAPLLSMVCHLIPILHPLVSIVLHLMSLILTPVMMLNLVFF